MQGAAAFGAGQRIAAAAEKRKVKVSVEYRRLGGYAVLMANWGYRPTCGELSWGACWSGG